MIDRLRIHLCMLAASRDNWEKLETLVPLCFRPLYK
jgi:hypothetical protein